MIFDIRCAFRGWARPELDCSEPMRFVELACGMVFLVRVSQRPAPRSGDHSPEVWLSWSWSFKPIDRLSRPTPAVTGRGRATRAAVRCTAWFGDRSPASPMRLKMSRELFRVVHSMTRSARLTSGGGIVSPRAFAVFRLITSSNWVGCSTGRSPGLAPLRILSTYTAARRQRSAAFGP